MGRGSGRGSHPVLATGKCGPTDVGARGAQGMGSFRPALPRGRPRAVSEPTPLRQTQKAALLPTLTPGNSTERKESLMRRLHHRQTQHVLGLHAKYTSFIALGTEQNSRPQMASPCPSELPVKLN